MAYFGICKVGAILLLGGFSESYITEEDELKFLPYFSTLTGFLKTLTKLPHQTEFKFLNNLTIKMYVQILGKKYYYRLTE